MNTATSIYTDARVMSDHLLANGVSDRLAMLMNDRVIALDTARNDVREAAERLADQMSRVVQYVDKGMTVNSLGEVQGRGFDVDRRCALLQCVSDELVRIVYVLPDELRAVVTAVAFPKAETR